MRLIMLVCACLAIAAMAFGNQTINPKTGPFVTVRVADRYGTVTIIDSVNIVAVHDNLIRLTRKGDFIGAWGVGQVEVLR